MDENKLWFYLGYEIQKYDIKINCRHSSRTFCGKTSDVKGHYMNQFTMFRTVL